MDEQNAVWDSIIPKVPSKEFAKYFKLNIMSSIGANDIMEYWNIGKRLQMEGHNIEYRFEPEAAAGWYFTVLRPALIETVGRIHNFTLDK